MCMLRRLGGNVLTSRVLIIYINTKFAKGTMYSMKMKSHMSLIMQMMMMPMMSSSGMIRTVGMIW